MKKIASILLAGWCLATATLALTWQEVLTLAGQNNNQIKAARQQAEAYRWTYYKSFSNFMPQLSANFSDGQTAASSGNSSSYSYGLSATQNLFSGLSYYYNLRSANVNFQYYQTNLNKALADVYYFIRQAFIELYAAQENLEVQEKILKYRSDNARMIKLFYNSGKEDKGNLLRAEAQVSEAQYNVNSAKHRLELARLKLSQLIDRKVEATAGELKAVSSPRGDLNSLLKKAPAYLLAQYQLELADIDRSATVAGFLPNVSLRGSYSKSGSDWPPGTSSNSITLNVSYSFFPGGSNIADRAIKGYLLDKAREDFKNSEKDIYYTIQNAYTNFVDALEAYKVQQTYLTASEERARIAQVRYLNGLTKFNDWDIIQNEFVSSENRVLTAQQAALLAEANWHKSFGGYIK